MCLCVTGTYACKYACLQIFTLCMYELVCTCVNIKDSVLSSRQVRKPPNWESTSADDSTEGAILEEDMSQDPPHSPLSYCLPLHFLPGQPTLNSWHVIWVWLACVFNILFLRPETQQVEQWGHHQAGLPLTKRPGQCLCSGRPQSRGKAYPRPSFDLLSTNLHGKP